MGSLGGDEAQAGLLPRAVRQIFDAICEDTSGSEFAVSCSYLEIYKEIVRDLLQSTNKVGGLAIREDARGSKGVFVEGLTEVFVVGENDVLECMSCGNANRVVGTTLMNAQSSRSHALLTITVHQKLSDGSTKVSKLNMADLAGSEKVAKTGSSGESLEEAKKINASLSALCLVISSLSDGKPHVPYRNSKLTRILQAPTHPVHPTASPIEHTYLLMHTSPVPSQPQRSCSACRAYHPLSLSARSLLEATRKR